MVVVLTVGGRTLVLMRLAAATLCY